MGSRPVSLRKTAYIAHNPQKGSQKQIFFIFHIKVGFSQRKSATKFLCVKTCRGKVVRHSVAYLLVHKWLVDVPFYVKFWAKLTHPLQ